MMLVRAKTTSHFKRSPTPPPVRSRSIKLNEQISCPAYHERISVGSETVLQLLSSSAKFNSTQSLCNRRKMTKRSGFFAGLKFWSKSHKSNTTNESQSKDDAYQMESTSTMSRINNNANTCCSPHQGNSSNTSSCQPELAVYESDPLKARLFEEYEEIFTSDDLNDSPKKMQRAHLGLKRRKSDKKRRNSFMLAPRVSVTEEIPSGLEELIHEPQNLKDFLSVKYLVLSFRKFLLSEFSEENLDFYIECDEYKGISSSQLIKEVASNIYEKYIKVDSAREINITVPIRKEIEAKLAAPDMIIFDHARNHIYHMMNNGAFRRYLQSDMYENLKKSFPVSTGNRKRRSDFIHSSFNKKLRR